MVPGLHGGKMSSSEESMEIKPSVLRLMLKDRQTVRSISSIPRISSRRRSTKPKVCLSPLSRQILGRNTNVPCWLAAPQITDGNGVLAFVEYALLPASSIKGQRGFRVDREGQEPLIYTDINQIQDDYKNDVVCNTARPKVFRH